MTCSAAQAQGLVDIWEDRPDPHMNLSEQQRRAYRTIGQVLEHVALTADQKQSLLLVLGMNSNAG